MFDRYSSTQKLCFAAVVAGSLACAVTGVLPYLQTGKITASDVLSLINPEIGSLANLVGLSDVALVEVSLGLFVYCLDSDVDGVSGCEGVLDDSPTAGRLAAVLWAKGFILAVISMATIFCRMCCFEGGRTVGQGILSFLAGGCFLASAILFSNSINDIWAAKLLDVKATWLLYVFFAGAGIVILASFALCCAYPESSLRGMIVSNGVRQPTVVVSTSSSSATTNNSAVPYTTLQNEPYPGHWPPQGQGHYNMQQTNASNNSTVVVA